jgi:hypothetical protein
MTRFLSILILTVMTGCASHSLQPTPRATPSVEQQRLHAIYRSAFERGFLDAWEGRHVHIDRFDKSTDMEGERAYDEGHSDGQLAGVKARLEYEKKQVEGEKKR